MYSPCGPGMQQHLENKSCREQPLSGALPSLVSLGSLTIGQLQSHLGLGNLKAPALLSFYRVSRCQDPQKAAFIIALGGSAQVTSSSQPETELLQPSQQQEAK